MSDAIGYTSTSNPLLSQQYASLERPRFKATIISSASGYAYDVNGIEQLQITKSENGDAGTFHFSFPLAGEGNSTTYVSDAIAADNAMPMDLVAIFGDRVTDTDAPRGWLGGGILKSSLSWGFPGAAVTDALAGDPTCLFIGMIDAVESDTDFTNASATCSIEGRDLTKILIDNDTFAPFTDPSGSYGLVSLYNVLIRRSLSGQQFLLTLLNVFVKKDPALITQLIATNTAATSSLAAAVKQLKSSAYGFPWDNFISQRLLTNPDFLHFPIGKFLPNFSVQNGSAWANMDDLRNFPIARLFINETGALVFDDTYSAWGYGAAPLAPVAAVTPDDIRTYNFRITDESLITALTVMPTLVPIGETSTASQSQLGEPYISSAVGTFGYRYQQFYSQWDAPDTGTLARQALKAKMGVIYQLHNDMNRARIVVKGSPRFRVGTRIVLQYADQHGKVLWGPRHNFQKAQKGGVDYAAAQVWYITAVSHQFSWGSDWMTTLELRFPFAVNKFLSPISTASLYDSISASA